MFDCLPLLNKLLAIRLIRRIKPCQSIVPFFFFFDFGFDFDFDFDFGESLICSLDRS